jgi:hypothetical protein
MTPDSLAMAIVKHFQPNGYMCDPCSGEGAFLRAFKAQNLPYCSYEIKNGTNFLAVPDNGVICHWIITHLGQRKRTPPHPRTTPRHCLTPPP